MLDILTVIVEMWFWVRSFFRFAKSGCENIHQLNISNIQDGRTSNYTSSRGSIQKQLNKFISDTFRYLYHECAVQAFLKHMFTTDGALDYDLFITKSSEMIVNNLTLGAQRNIARCSAFRKLLNSFLIRYRTCLSETSSIKQSHPLDSDDQ